MKRLLCLILIVILLISMAGCNGDADIIGIWEQKMEISILGVENTGTVMSVVRFVFREDGTGTQEQILPDRNHPNALREFTYTLVDSTITLDFGDNQQDSFTFTLKKDSLQLENRRGSYDLTRTK